MQLGLAAVATVVFTVYQFCNVDHYLYGGTVGYTVLDSLDAAVPWLFVIWSFLLFEPLARAVIDGRPGLSARGFLAPLMTRVLPTYYLAVVVVWLPRQQSLPGDWRDLLEHMTFTQVFDGRRIFYTIGPAWAVSVGAILTLALLVLTLGLQRLPSVHEAGRAERIRLLLEVALAIAIVALAWNAYSFGIRHRPTQASFTTWFGPLSNADSFAVGMVVAVVAVWFGSQRHLGRRLGLGLRAAGVALLVVAFAMREPDTWSTVFFAPLCSAAFGALVAAAVLGPRRRTLGGDTSWGRALQLLGSGWLGLFLWHEPIMLALRSHGVVRQSPGSFVRDLVIVLIASLLAGWLTLVLVQRPVLQVVSSLWPRLGRASDRSDADPA